MEIDKIPGQTSYRYKTVYLKLINTISKVGHNVLMLLTMSFILIGCSLNDEDGFPKVSNDVSNLRTEEPGYLTGTSSEITQKVNLIRESSALESLTKMGLLLSFADISAKGFYIQFLKDRLDLVDQFKKDEIGITEINSNLFSFIVVDSLFSEANLNQLSVSFKSNGTYEVFRAEKPLLLEFVLKEDGEDKAVIFEVDSVRIFNEGEATFLSYKESLTIDERVEYAYSLEMEYNQNLRSNYFIKQQYLLGPASLAFKLEKRRDILESGYSLSQDDELLVNSSISMSKDDVGDFSQGQLTVSIGKVEIQGELSSADDILNDIRLSAIEPGSLTTTKEEIQQAFDARIRLQARNKVSLEYIADVSIDSKIKGDGIVTGYTFLYPENVVVYLPDFLEDMLDHVDQDFGIFGDALR